jgi:hypothetical protein
MNRMIRFVLLFFMFLTIAPRLPAPISEVQETPSPTAARGKEKAAAAQHKTADSSESTLTKFEGTWRSTASSKNEVGSSLNYSYTLIIRSGVAEWTGEATIRLAPGTTWSNYPEPYNSISPIYRKWTARSTDLKLEGSNLTIRWPSAVLADWAPKSIPYGILNTAAQQPGETAYFLKQNQLISSDGTTSATWTRVK